jgi:hypothetical protein
MHHSTLQIKLDSQLISIFTYVLYFLNNFTSKFLKESKTKKNFMILNTIKTPQSHMVLKELIELLLKILTFMCLFLLFQNLTLLLILLFY